MKFTDGYWMMREGVRAHYAAEAYEIEKLGDELVAHVPTQKIRHRGDTLTGPLLTVTLSTPAEGVIKVKVVHFAGQVDRGPHFQIFKDRNAKPEIKISEEAAELTSGPLTARINKKDW